MQVLGTWQQQATIHNKRPAVYCYVLGTHVLLFFLFFRCSLVFCGCFSEVLVEALELLPLPLLVALSSRRVMPQTP